MITELIVDITDDPISGLKRKMKHHKFEINDKLEMLHWRRIILYENLGGNYGRPILQAIAEDQTLTPESKRLKSELYADQYVSVNTQNVLVNPQTGQPVSEDFDGAIPELEFWQGLPLAFIDPAPTKVSEAIYTLLGASMKSASNNGRV